MALNISEVAKQGRTNRRPRHTFNLKTVPYVIQPYMIAPVLPGETLSQAHIEVREVTAPLKSSIIGWSSEWFVFYVKIRDLNERDTLDDLFINPTANVTALNVAAAAVTNHGGGTPDYTALCLKRVTETYFRDEGEAWNVSTIGGLPLAAVNDTKWLDSVVDTTTLPDGGAIGITGTTTPEALDRALDAYEYLRSMALTSMNFEDYLRTFGVKLDRAEVHKPELIMRAKKWSYPANTINPADGTPTSAVSWAIEETSRDKKFIKEPGFIFGVHVLRPKSYFANLKGSLAHWLDTGLSWLPAIMRDEPETSLREFTNANGPITGATNGYFVDMRDLFVYGDQFSNVGWAATDDNSLAMPTPALGRRYPVQADIDALLVTAGGTVRSDGLVQLTIAGSVHDVTGGHQNLSIQV